MNARLQALLKLLTAKQTSTGRWEGPDQYAIELAKASAFIEIAIALERIAFAQETKNSGGGTFP